MKHITCDILSLPVSERPSTLPMSRKFFQFRLHREIPSFAIARRKGVMLHTGSERIARSMTRGEIYTSCLRFTSKRCREPDPQSLAIPIYDDKHIDVGIRSISSRG